MCLLLTCKKGTKIEFASPMRTVLFLDLREISQSDTIVKQFQKRTDFDDCLYYEPDKRKGLLKGFFPVIKYNNNNYSDLTEIS